MTPREHAFSIIEEIAGAIETLGSKYSASHLRQAAETLKDEEEVIWQYAMEHYSEQHCTLCGNRGVIDSRGVRTPAGVLVGRLNYCVCPNGIELRKKGGDMEWWLNQGVRNDR